MYRTATFNSSYRGRSIDEMVNSKAATLEEIERLRSQNTHKFHPEISRGPLNREDSGPIHDRLMQESTKLNSARQKRKAEVSRKFKTQKIETTSTNILEDKKKYILSNVFEVLDEDGDGVISANHCNFEALNSQLKDFFRGLMSEINESGVVLNKQDFIECSLELYRKLTPTQRNALIEAGKVQDRTPQEEVYPFSPSISLRSQQLANAVRPPAASVEERLLSREYSREGRSPAKSDEIFYE